MVRYAVAVAFCAWSMIARAQESARAGGIEGTVFDSLSRRPLAGATVQLTTRPGEEPRRTVTIASDSLGRFRLENIPGGRYLVSFAHPLLDSLGIEPVVREVDLRDRARMRVALATPSARRLIVELCPKGANGDSATLLVGHVRNARTVLAVPDASVSLAWPEVISEGNRLTSSEQRAEVATNHDGWFAICNAPAGIDLAARAASGADSTGRLLLMLTAGEVVRRELFVGPLTRDSASVAGRPAPLRGTATLRGRVVLGGPGTPVQGAQVQLWSTATRTTSGGDGWFGLTDLPAGSHTLDVRALGYIPVRVIVDLLDDGESEPVVVPMASAKHYLDTVRVTASRIYSRDSEGFERRRRMGVGRFITSEDVAKSPRMFVSDYLTGMSGVRTYPGPGGQTVYLRGSMGQLCAPAVYVDHLRLDYHSQFYGESNVDAYVWPSDIEGIEVYTRASQVPPLYNTMNDCGAIIIWTNRGKPSAAPPKKR